MLQFSKKKSSVTNPDQEMRDEVIKRARIYAVAFFALLLVQQAELDAERIRALNLTWASIIQVIGDLDVPGTFITALFVFVTGFLYDAKLHIFLDTSLFRVLDRTGDIIVMKIVREAGLLGLGRHDRFLASRQETKKLFYYFANNQSVLRTRAYSLWTSYYSSLLAVVIGLVNIGLMAFIGTWDPVFRITDIAILAAIAIVGVVTYGCVASIVPKIYDLPDQQIQDVVSSQKAAFIREVQNRFP